MRFGSWDQVAAQLARVQARWLQWGDHGEAVYYSAPLRRYIIIRQIRTTTGTIYDWDEADSCGCGR